MALCNNINPIDDLLFLLKSNEKKYYEAGDISAVHQ